MGIRKKDLKDEKIVSAATINKMKNNEIVTTETIDKLCDYLKCQPKEILGKPVPANILIVDINTATVWLYRSATYLEDIEKLYSGGASKDNSDFIGGKVEKVLHYD